MTFSELKMLCVVYAVRERLPQPSSDEWVHRNLKTLLKEVAIELIEADVDPVVIDSSQIKDLFIRLRKSTPTRLKAEVALTHGIRCYFENRGMGECSNDVELGHIVPQSRSGPDTVANCQIECRKHNNERREKTIEDYLKTKQ